MKLIVLALIQLVGVYGGQLSYEVPYGTLGVPQSNPAIPGASTTYHGNGRFIGFPSGLANPFATQTPVVRTDIVPAPAVPVAQPLLSARQVLPPQPIYPQTQALYPAQPVITKTLLPAQPILPAQRLVATHTVLQPQPFIPVTSYHAQPALLQKQVDIQTPAFKTSKYQVRRPGIQKQFYDIEERVVIRPAGSAVVELDPPHSKIHQGSFVTPGVPLIGAPIHDHQIINPAPANNQEDNQVQNVQNQDNQQTAQTQQENTDDTITVDAASRLQGDISYVRTANQQQNSQSGNIPQLTENQRLYIQQLLGDMMPQQLLNNQQQLTRQQQPNSQQNIVQQQQQEQQQQQPQQQDQQQQQVNQQQLQQQQQDNQQASTRQQMNQQQNTEQLTEQQRFDIQQIFNGQPIQQLNQQQQQSLFRQQINTQNVDLRFVQRKNIQEQVARNIGSNAIANNQQRLINLLTAREGITEINNQNDAQRSQNDDTLVRGRVVSAQMNQESNSLTRNSGNLPNEKVSTRRVVVARPIETVQEVHVVEPVTKLHRYTVQQPALLKSAHVQLQPAYYH